jgi:hypothetical protein
LHSTAENKGVDFMNNKFIKELAIRLLPITSFDEMQGILEDYTGFMSEAEIHEKPKDVVRSLEIDKRKGYISSIIYFALLVISFFAMNSIRRMGWNMFVFFSIVLLLLCIMVLFSTYFLWGKKLSLVSQYSNLKIKDKFGAVVLSVIPLIIIVGFSFFMIFSLNQFITHSIQMLTGNIIDISFLVLFVCGIIDFILMFLKGSKYFLSTTINYSAFACLVQSELFCISIIDNDISMNTLVVVSFLVEFFVLALIALILSKKIGVVRK